jgi:general secretion pathway protein M
MFAHRPKAADKLLELRAQTSERRGPASARKVTVEGFSNAAASAELQSHIEELGTSIDTTIDSTESISAEVRGSYHPADPRYVLVGAYETWVRRFAKLEAATPPLVIDNLHIHGLRVDRRTGRPRAPGPETLTLNAGPDLCGFRTNKNLSVVRP